MADTITLADLGVDDDPGTDWHPRQDKTEARDSDGNLCDLTDAADAEHPAAAEDSIHSPNGKV